MRAALIHCDLNQATSMYLMDAQECDSVEKFLRVSALLLLLSGQHYMVDNKGMWAIVESWVIDGFVVASRIVLVPSAPMWASSWGDRE